MSPERQQQIEELTTQALQQPLTQRHTWLTQQCADDQELRNEVESHLIAQTAVTGAPFTQEVSVSFAPDTG